MMNNENVDRIVGLFSEILNELEKNEIALTMISDQLAEKGIMNKDFFQQEVQRKFEDRVQSRRTK